MWVLARVTVPKSENGPGRPEHARPNWRSRLASALRPRGRSRAGFSELHRCIFPRTSSSRMTLRYLRCMQACTYGFIPPPPPPAPPRGFRPICIASARQRSSFSPAPGLFRLAQSKRIGPGGYCRQSSARALGAAVNRMIETNAALKTICNLAIDPTNRQRRRPIPPGGRAVDHLTMGHSRL
jgi:hypothetical protein